MTNTDKALIVVGALLVGIAFIYAGMDQYSHATFDLMLGGFVVYAGWK